MRPITDLQRTVAPFRVEAEFEPSGDQPAAIEELARRVTAGETDVVLLGATGTGKSATTAWLIEQVQRPTLVMAPNKTLAAQLANELRELLPEQRGRVLRELLRLLPARGLRPADRHLHREGLLDQRRGRAAAPQCHELAPDPPRRRRRRVGLVHLRPGHPAGVRRPHGRGYGSASRSKRDRCCAASWRCSTPATTSPSRAAPSGCAATRSRSSRSTRSSPIRIEFFGDEIERIYTLHPLTGEVIARRRRCTSSPPPTMSPAPSGWSARSPGIEKELADQLASSKSRASCWRRSGCGCAPPTTSR
jgi:excinuclease ABC subunit B